MPKISRLSFDALWYHRHPFSLLLLPLSMVYALVMKARAWLYRIGVMETVQLSVPVIVVGNLTVGGTGKTPTVIACVNALKARGYRPGVLSRGYGGGIKTAHLVAKGDDAAWVGDEPWVIYQQTTVPVMVGRDRVANGQSLVDKGCDVIVCDDGFQHLRLHRDVDIVVVDGDRGFGNGHCLPGGPLRESMSALQRADIMLINGANMTKLPRLASFGSGGIFRGNYRWLSLQTLDEQHKQAIADCAGLTVHAVTAIGNPERFIAMLKAHDIIVNTHIFRDHYVFEADDVSFDDQMPVIMTQKDAAKCRRLLPVLSHPERYWYVQTEFVIDADFFDKLINKIQ